MRRAGVIAVATFGAALIAAPLAFGMFSRAPQGASMLTDFAPFMTADRLHGFSGHLVTIDDAVEEIDRSGAGRDSASFEQFSKQWPVVDDDMSGLMDEVTENLGNYRAMAGMPSFTLFPWFFAVPGAVLLGVGVLSLRRGRWTRSAQVAGVVVGIGLVVAPVALGIFSAAPKGAEMMKAFKTLETEENVTRIQGYFAQMAIGQGAVRLEVVPALEKSGLTPAQVAAEYPATTRLNEEWIPILNDMTPMIGAMSDNVDNYDAIAGLPSFGLFGWFFVLPGVCVLAAVAAAGRPQRHDAVAP